MNADTSSWIDSLPPDTRGSVHNVMVRLRTRSNSAFLKSAWRSQRPGDVLAVGSAHLDDYLKSFGIAEFLRELTAGATPKTAVMHAQQALRAVVHHWNEGHEWQLARDSNSGEEHIQSAAIVLDMVVRASLDQERGARAPAPMAMSCGGDGALTRKDINAAIVRSQEAQQRGFPIMRAEKKGEEC